VLVVLAGSAHWLRHKLVRKHLARTLPMPTVPPASPYPDPPGIVLHDSDSPAVVHGIPINAANLERIHKRDHPHWATTFEGKTYHIAYHYVILPDGKIEKGRPDHCVGAHARTHNDWLGICVVGAFSANNNPHWWPQTPTPAEVRSTVTLCEELMSKYHIPPERVKRHRDLNDTYCPGGRFPYFAILAQLQAYASTHPETRPLTNRVVSLAHPPPPGRKRRLKRMRDEG
jgi:N-acetylmuramoyl-L-alanine amidase